MSDDELHEIPFENEASNPNAAGPQGAAGGMGVSSERTGPEGEDPRDHGIAGTGSRGGSVTGTDGTEDVFPTPWDATDVSREDVAPDERGLHGTEDIDTGQNVDRTVGEPHPAPIADEKNRR